MSQEPRDLEQQQHFVTTHWSVVLAAQDKASPNSQSALETLCHTYWYPVYAYIRKMGYSPHDAQDLTQEFFARLLSQNWLQVVQPEKGRFRTFLLVATKRFLAKEWQKASAQKRGGGMLLLPLDNAEHRFACEPALGADELYERRWAMTLLEQTLNRVSEEFEGEGRGGDFDELKSSLTAGRGEVSYAELATKLGMTEGAARVAVHRLRKRFRQVFRESVAQTVEKAEEVESEMRHLVSILSSASV